MALCKNVVYRSLALSQLYVTHHYLNATRDVTLMHKQRIFFIDPLICRTNISKHCWCFACLNLIAKIVILIMPCYVQLGFEQSCWSSESNQLLYGTVVIDFIHFLWENTRVMLKRNCKLQLMSRGHSKQLGSHIIKVYMWLHLLTSWNCLALQRYLPLPGERWLLKILVRFELSVTRAKWYCHSHSEPVAAGLVRQGQGGIPKTYKLLNLRALKNFNFV